MKTIQIKTLELLLIKALNSKNFSKDKIYSSFRYMLNHFSDDDYLYAFNHRRIISVIYLENFYAHKTVKALTQYLHIDNKTLLSYRKAYLKLFAKQYMNLASFKKQIFYFYILFFPKIYKPILWCADSNFSQSTGPEPRKVQSLSIYALLFAHNPFFLIKVREFKNRHRGCEYRRGA